MNGSSWPDLDPVPPELEELPENPNPGQIIRVLGTTLLAFGQLWPRAVQALLYLKAAVERLEHLPPMRRAEDSSSFIAQTAERAGEIAKRKAEQIVADPRTDLTPDVVRDLMKAEVKAALKQQRDTDRVAQLQAVADKVKADEEAKKLDDARKVKDRKRMKRDITVGIVVGIALLVAGALFTFAEGRMRGFAEHAAIAPTATVYIQVPVPAPAPAASFRAAPP